MQRIGHDPQSGARDLRESAGGQSEVGGAQKGEMVVSHPPKERGAFLPFAGGGGILGMGGYVVGQGTRPGPEQRPISYRCTDVTKCA